MGKNIDEELAAVAGLNDQAPISGADAAEESAMAVPDPAEPRQSVPAEGPATNMGFLLALLVMVVGIVVLFMFGFKEAAIYSTPIAQMVEKGDEMVGRRMRLEGELVPGSLTKRDSPCEYRFVLKGDGKRLPIRYPQCIIPDTFRDVPDGGVLVTVEGELVKDGYFKASMIMAKC